MDVAKRLVEESGHLQTEQVIALRDGCRAAAESARARGDVTMAAAAYVFWQAYEVILSERRS